MLTVAFYAIFQKMARIENVDSKIIKGVAGECIIIGFWVDIPIAYYHISADQYWISSI